MKAVLAILFVLLVSCDKIETDSNTFTDERDGQTYATIEIGDNTWMAENLNYRPGGYNYLVTEKYGILYPFDEAVQYCPKGWRLPTKEEWATVLGSSADLRSGDFKAKLSGWVQGEYLNDGEIGAWWASDEYNDKYSHVFYIKTDTELAMIMLLKSSMLAVRCVKD